MIPAQRTGAHDRLILADGHPHAGLEVVIVQPVRDGYLVRIGNDPARITPQVVAADQILIEGAAPWTP
jgi:hypothetical protein